MLHKVQKNPRSKCAQKTSIRSVAKSKFWWLQMLANIDSNSKVTNPQAPQLATGNSTSTLDLTKIPQREVTASLTPWLVAYILLLSHISLSLGTWNTRSQRVWDKGDLNTLDTRNIKMDEILCILYIYSVVVCCNYSAVIKHKELCFDFTYAYNHKCDLFP